MAASADAQLPTKMTVIMASKQDVDRVQDPESSIIAGSGGVHPSLDESTLVGTGGESVLEAAAAAALITAVGPSAVPTAAAEAARTEESPGRAGGSGVGTNSRRATAISVVSVSSVDSAEEGSPLEGHLFPVGVESSSPRENDSSSRSGGNKFSVRRGDGVDLKAKDSRDVNGGGVADVIGATVKRCPDSNRTLSPPSLTEWLKQGPFVLAMAPGFFGFYAHIGALMALGDADLLGKRVSFATGASAGGLIAGLFAAGLSPRDMGRIVVKFRRPDFWDPVGFGGVLRGKKFEALLRNALPDGVERFDQCRVPLALSAFDISRLKTRTLTEGDLAPALRATCTFPGLFAPVWHPRGVLIDGGVSDTAGMWCVPYGREDCRRVLNVTFGCKGGVRPSSFPTGASPRPEVEIATLALTGIPRPHPFAMERGTDALEGARSQVAAVLNLPLLPGKERSHWIAPTQAPEPKTQVSDAGGASGKRRQQESGVERPDSEAGGAAEARENVEKKMGGGMVSRPGSGRGKMLPEALQRKKRRRTGLWSWSCHDKEGESSGGARSECLLAMAREEAAAGVESERLKTDEVAQSEQMLAAQQSVYETVGVAPESGGARDVARAAVIPGLSGSGVVRASVSAGQGSPADGAVRVSIGRKVEQTLPRKSGRIRKPKVTYNV